MSDKISQDILCKVRNCRKFDVAYFKYDKHGENERIQTESAIGRKRLITLLETPSFNVDVYFVENSLTCEIYLSCTDEQFELLEKLKSPGGVR